MITPNIWRILMKILLILTFFNLGVLSEHLNLIRPTPTNDPSVAGFDKPVERCP